MMKFRFRRQGADPHRDRLRHDLFAFSKVRPGRWQTPGGWWGPPGATGGIGQGSGTGMRATPPPRCAGSGTPRARCRPRGGEQRTGHRPPLPGTGATHRDPPPPPRSPGSRSGPGNGAPVGGQGPRVRGTPGCRLWGHPRGDAHPGGGSRDPPLVAGFVRPPPPECGGGRLGGCPSPLGCSGRPHLREHPHPGDTLGQDATPSRARHPLPQPHRGGGLPRAPRFPHCPCPVASLRPRSPATAVWGAPWPPTLSGPGASPTATLMPHRGGSAPCPTPPGVGYGGGWTPWVHRALWR